MQRFFEMDLTYIRKGLLAEVSTPFSGGEILSAKVVSMDRVIDPRTRTAKVRIQLNKLNKNTSIKLRPESYVDVNILIPMGEHLSISRECMMDTGRDVFAFVKKEEGIFVPKRLHVLFTTDEYIAIKDGFQEGEEVVVGGHFMLDSESRLKSVLRKSRGQEQ